MDGVDLDALDALMANATPGPWFRDGSCMYVPSGDTHIADADRHADAALIVAAVNALPALFAHVRALEACVRAADAAYMRYGEMCADTGRDPQTCIPAMAAYAAARAAAKE